MSIRIQGALVLVMFGTSICTGDVAVTNTMQWAGNIDFHLAGVALAEDTDADNKTDSISTPASVVVPSFGAGSTLVKAVLYWGGTQSQPAGPLSGVADSEITFTAPGGTPATVNAETVYGSDGGSSSYDVFICKADVTSLIGSAISGTYTIDSYNGKIGNNSTDNASAALLLILDDPSEPYRSITALDGLQVMSSSTYTQHVDGFVTSLPGNGRLAYYTMEGDIASAGESVMVSSPSSGSSLVLSDAINPVDAPMNRTINTSEPTQTGTVGVDVDEFDISSVVSSCDTSLDAVFSAGVDKWWHVLTVLSVEAESIVTRTLRWEGHIDFHLAGVALAEDTDFDNKVDTLISPASMVVPVSAVDGASLVKAYLYWGGSQVQPAGPLSGSADSSVEFTAPGSTAVVVNADVVCGSDGGSATYDVFIAKADVTSLLGSMLSGTYTVDEYSGKIADGSTDHASAALLLILDDPTEPYRSITAIDDFMTMSQNSHTQHVNGLVVAPSTNGKLAYYTMEGDASSADESVIVTNRTNSSTMSLSDAINPATGLMNATINTSDPVQTGTIGIDIDKFDISSALSSGEASLDVIFSTGVDKWWSVLTMLSVEAVPQPIISSISVDGSGADVSLSNLLVDVNYTVQETESLLVNWTNATSITASGGITNWLDVGTVSTSRFYRVVVP